MWLSHHYPDDYDRCVRVGERHICRRCVWFYPVCFAVAGLTVAGVHWPTSLDPWLLWLIPLPVVAEWWLEHLGRISYSARRQVALSLLVAPAVGRGLGRYLEHPGDRLFWAVVITYAIVCAAAMFVTPVSVGPGDAPELERIGEQPMTGHDPYRDAAPTSDVEGEVGPVPVVAVDDVVVG